MNVLVDAKNEYTIRIINILSPLILEGLNSIYKKASDISSGDNVLKIFQSFLKRIPKWSNEILDCEVNRIKTNCKNFDLLYDLIRAAIKANLSVLVFNPFGQQNKPKIDSEYYKKLDFGQFIHNIYLECAREVWNNPYLFYHNYTAIEIKRNQRDTIELIKRCIEETIRKTLPLKHVLEIYLGDDVIQPIPDDNFEKTITEVDEKNLENLLKKELDESFITKKFDSEENILNSIGNTQNNTQNTQNNTQNTNNNTQNTANNTQNTVNNTDSSYTRKSNNSSSELKDKSTFQKGGTKSSTDKPLNSKILSILNDDNLNLSDENETSEKRIERKKLSETSSDDLISSNMDSNLKKILKKDLGNTESDSSMQFKPEQNSSKYQEIFSNSNNTEKSINSQEKNEEINKNKFFNNYLQF